MKPLILACLLGATAAGAEPVNYLIDPTHTFAHFETLHKATSVLRGRFDRKEGSVMLDRAAKSGRVEIKIDITSVNTGVLALNRAIQSPEMLDASSFPSASFTGDRFVFEGMQLIEVGGTLTLKGREQALTLKATRFNCYLNPLFRREVCGGEFEAVVQRSAWGLGEGLPDFAADAVQLLISVEATRQ